MYEIVTEFYCNGVPMKVGPLDMNAIPKDHLECAIRNKWVAEIIAIESQKKTQSKKTKE